LSLMFMFYNFSANPELKYSKSDKLQLKYY
jgi:hypothetical protein